MLVAALTRAWAIEQAAWADVSPVFYGWHEYECSGFNVDVDVEVGRPSRKQLSCDCVTGVHTFHGNGAEGTLNHMNGQHELKALHNGSEGMSPNAGATIQTRSEERRTRRPEEVGQILGIGRNGIYDLIRRGELRSISVGRKILIPLEAIEEFLNNPQR